MLMEAGLLTSTSYFYILDPPSVCFLRGQHCLFPPVLWRLTDTWNHSFLTAYKLLMCDSIFSRNVLEELCIVLKISWSFFFLLPATPPSLSHICIHLQYPGNWDFVNKKPLKLKSSFLKTERWQPASPVRFENVWRKHISLQLRLSTMDSLTDAIVMDAISAAISFLWCSEVDSILSRNTEQVFHRMVPQSAP